MKPFGTKKLRILVVEDEKSARTRMAANLQEHAVEYAVDLHSAVRSLDSRDYDICFIDLRLSPEADDCSGFKLIPLAVSKGIYSVVMSGLDSEELVSKAYKLGCRDYYAKGNETANLADIIARFRQRKGEAGAEDIFSREFVTEDPKTREHILEAIKIAPATLPILILGPSGTGKTKLARILHDRSGRAGDFVALNCAAYTEDLLEAELFGYRKGAFTDARDNRSGRLLLADKGTLFLDEVGAMSLNMQTKLLKAIEERTFHPLGSDRPTTSEFRIISATLEDPAHLLEKKRLRFDFFQRIHGYTITLKPLAHRRCDILPLVWFFNQGERRLAFTKEAKECLQAHSWPGNARELKGLLDILASGSEGRVQAATIRRHLTTAARRTGFGGFVTESQYRHALDNGLNKTVDRIVAEIIERNLAENEDRKKRTMRALNISSRLVYATLKKLERPADSGQD